MPDSNPHLTFLFLLFYSSSLSHPTTNRETTGCAFVERYPTTKGNTEGIMTDR
jgi:hypothetical protein